MKKEIKEAAKKETLAILKRFNIKTKQDEDNLDEYNSCVLYENLKAGVIEEFGLEDKDMEKIYNEVYNELP